MDRQAHEYAAAAYAQQKAAALAAAAAAQHQYAVASGGASPFPPQYGTHGVIGQPPPPPHFIPHHAPPHPHHLPHLQPQQNFPPYSHHAQMPPHHQIPLPYTNIPQLHHPPPLTPSPQQQHHIPTQQFFNPWDPTPAPVLPPADPELQKRIDKLAEYAAKNGPEFENMIREKQQDNPDYAFLFGAEGHSYYRYKLWLFCTRPFPPPPHHVGMNPLGSGTSAFPSGGAGGGFYDQHGMGQGVYPRVEYDGREREREREKSKFKGLSGPLPSDVAAELNSVLVNLSGTKESIKGAKSWFMQRSPFAPALAEALKDRVMVLDDPERQLHIIYVANDILFDSLQRRSNIKELDNEALAFQPVLGPMLAKIYHNPQNKDANQSRLQKILQFWGSKEVYDSETIYNLEGDMIAGPPAGVGHSKDNMAKDLSIGGFAEKEQQDRSITPPQYFGSAAQFSSSQPFATSTTNSVYSSGAQAFPSSVTSAAVQPPLQATNAAMPRGENQPPYPLFPPGLIPGMVRKMQIGSGVPYSPLSPLDIPTVIPPSTASPNYILERVSKFFKDIGEVNPIEGQAEDEEEREPPRTGGACIPPPPTLHVDPDTGMLPDGSVPSKKGSNSGRLGLGATADPNEVSQYDDVYTSYRKQRSTNYHTSMSARASAK